MSHPHSVWSMITAIARLETVLTPSVARKMPCLSRASVAHNRVSGWVVTIVLLLASSVGCDSPRSQDEFAGRREVPDKEPTIVNLRDDRTMRSDRPEFQSIYAIEDVKIAKYLTLTVEVLNSTDELKEPYTAVRLYIRNHNPKMDLGNALLIRFLMDGDVELSLSFPTVVSWPSHGKIFWGHDDTARIETLKSIVRADKVKYRIVSKDASWEYDGEFSARLLASMRELFSEHAIYPL